ncbi:alpha/beta hydrolase [Penicillium cataractarum]|uniref:Alpha/beta hydrolase n=1 Tax=Penicillium cataractarum TaxID=2100454 RepID=A0A9W9VE20_9EURO|nr:alpha/beta hydrolase [Penicillium cataractarum]KAJ5377334.1 alpha/beta hydrolase [Penicillium cataractarum]
MESCSFQTSPNSVIHAHITRPAKEHSKPLLLFLHYWGGSSQTWHKLTDLDSSTSLSVLYPTIAIDLRGWGQSTGPTDKSGKVYSINEMASDVATLLAHLSEDHTKEDLLEHGFLLVGHSMGAKVALATIGLLNNNLQGLLKGLVLVGPAPPIALDLPPEMKAQQLLAYESEDSVRWTVNNVLAKPGNLSESDIELVAQDSLRGTTFAKVGWLSYGMQEDISQDVQKALASRPGLQACVIVGELDIVETRERTEKEVVHFLRQNGVEVPLTVVEGVQHLIPLEDPESIYKEISRYW